MEAARSAFVTGKLEGELVTAGDASTDALPSPTCTPPQNLGSKLAKKVAKKVTFADPYTYAPTTSDSSQPGTPCRAVDAAKPSRPSRTPAGAKPQPMRPGLPALGPPAGGSSARTPPLKPMCASVRASWASSSGPSKYAPATSASAEPGMPSRRRSCTEAQADV